MPADHTIGDDGSDAVVITGGGDGLLAAHRHADHSHTSVAHVAARQQVIDAGFHVEFAVPTHQVRFAAAASVTTDVEHQDTESLACQCGCALDLAIASTSRSCEQHHRGAVLRRHVPRLETYAVGGAQLDVFVPETDIRWCGVAERHRRRVGHHQS